MHQTYIIQPTTTQTKKKKEKTVTRITEHNATATKVAEEKKIAIFHMEVSI
jgi:hypothetical protein